MNNLSCSDCGESFGYPSQLERHKNSKKKCGKNKTITEIICNYCNKTYATKHSLIRHQTTCKSKNKNNIVIPGNNVNVNTNTNSNVVAAINNISNVVSNTTDKENILDSINTFINYMNDGAKNENYNQKCVLTLQNILGFITNANANKKHNSNAHAHANNNNTSIIPVNNIPVNNIPVNTIPLINNSNSAIEQLNINNGEINNGEINNGNINNGVINNTFANMQVLYPFGKENIDFLSNSDKLEILKSPNGLVLALDKIYSRLENKNFRKRNLNKDSITVINSALEIEVLRETKFRKTLIEQTILALRRIFFSCKNELSIPHQITVWKNIKSIEENSNDQNISDIISNLIELNSEDISIKKLFDDSKKNILNTSFKKKCLELVNNIIAEINKYKNDLNKVSLSDEIIKDESWIRDENDSDDINLDNENNNINNVHFEDTPRCKFYKEMEQCELNYLSTKGSNDLSVGDIDFLCNREYKKAITEYNTLCEKYNPPITYREDLRNKIIVEPITKSKDALNYVKLKKNNAQKNITK